MLFASALRWINIYTVQKRCQCRASWKDNFTAFQSNIQPCCEGGKMRIASRHRPPACHRLHTEHLVLKSSSDSLVTMSVSQHCLSIWTRSGHSDPSHLLLPGILSSVSHPPSGLTWQSVKIHASQKKVRIACLCWLESAGPTIHPGQWAQSLRKERN